MPWDFSASELLELVKWGKFTIVQIAGTIAAADAVTVTATPFDMTPAVETELQIDRARVVLTERFNWGDTSKGGVYYELWSEGIPGPEWAAMTQGFYCGGTVRGSNLDNVCTHIMAGTSITVKLWNCSSPPADVDYDLTVWYYWFWRQHLGRVMDLMYAEPRHVVAAMDEIKALLRENNELLRQYLSVIRVPGPPPVRV